VESGDRGGEEDVWSRLAAASGEKYLLFENFEEIKPPDWPSGWTIANDNGDNKQWESWSFGGSRGGQCLRYLSHSTNAANDWLFSPAISLNSGTEYTLDFKTRVTPSLLPHKLSTWIGTAPTTDSMTTQLFSRENITNAETQETSGTFTVTSTGSYYIGFKCYSNANNLALFVDDVLISHPATDLEAHVQMVKAIYTPGSSSYAPDEEIKCLAYVKNVGASTLTVNGLLTGGHESDPDAVLYFTITGPTGAAIPFEAKYKAAAPRAEDFKSLQPGEAVYKIYDLNSGAFDFTASGAYTIRAIYKNYYK
jgi:hypothetical protein